MAPNRPSYCPIAEPRWALRFWPNPCGLVDLGAAEGVRALAGRSPETEEALRPEAPDRVARREPALGEAELVVRAPRDGEVALVRIERPLDHAQRLDQLRDDEVRVGVAVAVEVPALVDGDAADGELDVLPLARVEAAHEHLLGVPLAAFVGEQDAGRELEEIGRVRVRQIGELADRDLEVGGAAAWSAAAARAR